MRNVCRCVFLKTYRLSINIGLSLFLIHTKQYLRKAEYCNSRSLFYVPCLFNTSVIMALHSFLCFPALSKVCLFTTFHNHSSAKYLHKLVRQGIQGFSLSRTCPQYVVVEAIDKKFKKANYSLQVTNLIIIDPHFSISYFS